MTIELDHFFILTDIGAPQADRLLELGLTEGPPNHHPGQGTANRRFFFRNAMLEFLWVHDPEEARAERTRRTGLWQRWSGRHAHAVPFGLCLRPGAATIEALPFAAWEYAPTYLPANCVVHVAESSRRLEEPMLFYMSFGRRPDRAAVEYPLEHPAGMRELTSLTLGLPDLAPISPALQAIAAADLVRLKSGQTCLMELGFDGEAQSQSLDLRPGLPLILRW